MKLLDRSKPLERTEDVLIDFVSELGIQEGSASSVEIVCHPRYNILGMDTLEEG